MLLKLGIFSKKAVDLLLKIERIALSVEQGCLQLSFQLGVVDLNNQILGSLNRF